MNILITGVCGFVGFSLANKLLKSKKFQIYGIDNVNSYYSKKLKYKRLDLLKENKNFFFYKKDINAYASILNRYKNIKFDVIYHFAAQAGVRYTVIDPNSYLHSNIKAFKNFCKFVKFKKPKKFIFASSSSVYGDMKTYPVKENNKLNPKNLYAKTKKFNEVYVENYFKKTKIKCIGLRLFTIYGEWGRPDMLIFKFLKMADKRFAFNLNNNGNMYRDFTYIDSVIRIITKLILFEFKKKFMVFNICSSKPIKISSVIKKLIKITNHKKINYIPMNKLEVFKTYGDNNKIFKTLKINKKFVNFDIGLKRTFNWYKKNKNII